MLQTITQETKAQIVTQVLDGTLVKELTARLYASRKARRTHPEGAFDRARRWYPSEREDQDGDGTCVRLPSRAFPFSYMTRCRTRQHCRTLVEAALRGESVPPDVEAVVRGI